MLAFAQIIKCQVTDSLEPVEVLDYRIKTEEGFREQILVKDSISALSAPTLAQMLSDFSAASVRTYGGPGIATLSLRGTGANHTRIYWNNLDLNSPSLGLTDLSTIPTAGFDQLSIQYGFASLNDGSGALGGSVRLKQMPRIGQPLTIGLQALVGQYGRSQNQVNVSIGKDNWGSQSSVYFNQSLNNFSFKNITLPGFPEQTLENARLIQRGINQSLHYRSSDYGLWSAHLWWQETDRELPEPMTSTSERFSELYDQSLAMVSSYEHNKAGRRWLINSGLHQSLNRFSTTADSVSSNNRFWSWQNNLRHQRKLNRKLNLESGAHFRYEKAKSQNLSEAAERYQSSLFTSLNWTFAELPGDRRWEISLLLRQELIDQWLAPLVGHWTLSYRDPARAEIALSLARNYRYPTLNELYWIPGGNPNLAPERSWNSELYYRWLKPFNLPGFLHLGIFYNQIDDFLQWITVGDFWSPRNVKEVTNAGLEAELKIAKSWGKWQIAGRADYRYTRSYNRAVYELGENLLYKQLRLVPFHQASAGASLQYKAWVLRYTQNWTGLFYADAINQTYMPAFTTAQVALEWREVLNANGHRLKAALIVENIFDYDYQMIPYRPQPGRWFNFQLTYQWARR